LKQAVRRNMDRFPQDFMFTPTDEEVDLMVSQNVIPFKKVLWGSNPCAYTDFGIAMLSSVLKSKRAIGMNIAIIRTFVFLRYAAANHQELLERLESMERKYEGRFKEINPELPYQSFAK
jgi:hypothetical protein